MGYRAFVSYSTEDLDFARKVFRSIEVLGFEPFLADRSLQAGGRLSEIRQAIRTSHVVIVLWSQAASDSHWVRDEIGVASGAQIPMLPVLISDFRPMPPSLDGVKYLDARTRSIENVLEIQSVLIGHWNQLLLLDERARVAFEAEQRRKREAANNNALLGLLTVGGVALLAAGAAKSPK